MNIAFLTQEYPHPRVQRAAGIGTSIKNLAESLVANKIGVSLFIYDQKEDAVFEENGITFHLIKKIQYKFLGWYLYRKHIARYINNTHAVHTIDVLEAADWTGITAFMKLKMPLVIRLHGTDAYFCNLEGRPQKKKNFWFESKALKSAEAVISVSTFTAEKTKEIFQLSTSIITLYNGIDVEKFKPLQLPKQPNSILYFGSIIRKKGVLDLAKAFQLLQVKNPDASLTLIGANVVDVFEKKPTLELFYKCLDDSAKKRVTHLAHMPYEEVVQQIAKAEVLVLPSRAEAFPMTWLEAMAMEKAMVTSNIGWANELMIDNETGLMIDPDNHQGLADAMGELLSNPEKAERFGKNARKRIVSNFSSEIIVKQNIDYYTQFVK
ncbi:glycosyltransferase family 4 protein [Ulvibacter litoralis]|uniref:Glycosyltransferase involved in cell wall bisynthesis n=1 Tax=Ulvibacter litoralis TaxID=227084 RepID=A0A1G7GW78_9FLAO|nr:glycosyltransferase family 4 protein [Ulvibacter litoralis]GHC59909.1 glycoside hydrolase [Ulvibacter litoralis]SDE92361.1 Glycosyltransferase involved in cell wall bisynthesis [Ulvibacter litoralis]